MIFLAALLASVAVSPTYPTMSPDGTQLAWVEGSTSQIWESAADGTGAHVAADAPTAEGISSLAWTRYGLVADSNFTLWLLPKKRLEPAGFTFSTGGPRVASGPERGPGPLVVTNIRTRAQVEVGLPQVNNSNASLSPNGTHVAWNAGGAVWVARVGGTPRRLAAKAGCPSWSPDGRSIAFLRFPEDELRVISAAGGRGQMLMPHAGGCNEIAWSRDSRVVAVATGFRIAAADTRSGTVTRSALGFAGGFAWSADGTEIFASHRPAKLTGDNCLDILRLDARTLNGGPVVTGCP